MGLEIRQVVQVGEGVADQPLEVGAELVVWWDD
jgi:hypothetical protein